jgi:membrane-associated protein
MRTFVPFVAGLGRMEYRKFLLFSAGAALLWVGLLVPAGYWFGNLPLVKDNLGVVVVAIVAISLAPVVLGLLRARLDQR